MAGLKRRFARYISGQFGLQLIRNGSASDLVESDYLRRFFGAFKIDCVFDVGANVGQYAELLRSIGFHGLIISFEPNPNAASTLREAAKNRSDWVIKELALDSESRTVNFNVMKRSTFSSLREPDDSQTTLFTEMNAIERQVTVRTRTLSELFPEIQAEFGFSRPFLKMDTQGNDVSVARGAGAYISRFVGLQSELSFTKLYKNAPDAKESLEYYESLGFKLSSFVPNNAGHFPDLYEIDCVMYNNAFRSTID